MNAHKRHGYTHSDVVDYAVSSFGRRRSHYRICAHHINSAGVMRRWIGTDKASRFMIGDYRTDEDLKRLAFRELAMCASWRDEVRCRD